MINNRLSEPFTGLSSISDKNDYRITEKCQLRRERIGLLQQTCLSSIVWLGRTGG